jgi:hypothetical protein
VNLELMRLAFENPPSLIVDCANCANPHRFFPEISEEQLHGVYVINAEAIYRFRDTLMKLPYWLDELGISHIIVTTTNIMFSYDDEQENHDILEHCWQLMRKLGQTSNVVVGISGAAQEELAQVYADKII